MKHILIGLCLAAIVCGAASAQTPPDRPAVDPLAVKPISPRSSTADGDMMRSKIERIGYSNVTDLTRDSTGLWHAHAIRDNEPVELIVDKGGRIKPELR
jgi:hypothetical protein